MRSCAFCCLKFESTISVVPAKRKREPGLVKPRIRTLRRAAARSATAAVHSSDARDDVGALPTFARNTAENTSHDCEPSRLL
jgi:hypothetical protein